MITETGTSTTRQRITIQAWPVPPVGQVVSVGRLGNEFSGEWKVVDVRGYWVDLERELSSQHYVTANE